MGAQSRQGRLELASEINVLPAAQAEGHLGVPMEQDGDDGLLILECPRPFVLADRLRLDAVTGHDEQQAVARTNGFSDRLVPFRPWFQLALVQPCRDRRRACDQLIAQLQSEIQRVSRRVTDKVMSRHRSLLSG